MPSMNSIWMAEKLDEAIEPLIDRRKWRAAEQAEQESLSNIEAVSRDWDGVVDYINR